MMAFLAFSVRFFCVFFILLAMQTKYRGTQQQCLCGCNGGHSLRYRILLWAWHSSVWLVY